MLQTLELNNFRSYKSGLFGFEPGVNIIVGPNASGKTNLLEAIHMISALNGFKTHEKDLISIGADWSRLEALTDLGVRIVKIQTDNKKTIEIDGVKKMRLTNNDSLPIVVFEPEHMLMLGNEPEKRRNYIDSILNLTVPHYKKNHTAYKRALAQRNRLLKDLNFSPDQLFVWDLQLSEKAGVIAKARKNLVDKLNEKCAEFYREISKKKEDLTLEYVSKLEQDNYSDSLLKYLKQNIEKDKLRGFTGAGPHRDDVSVYLNGNDTKTTASRGEARSVVLALKIVELKIVEELSGKSPIFILDDVFSELDGSRRRHLAEMLSEYQTFITTTDADIVIDHFQDSCNIIPTNS